MHFGDIAMFWWVICGFGRREDPGQVEKDATCVIPERDSSVPMVCKLTLDLLLSFP